MKIHHIGVACRSIKAEFTQFAALGFEKEAEFVDEIQGVRGIFIVSKFTPCRLELLENLHENGVLNSYLKNHTKLYHIAYECENIEQSLENLRVNLANGGGGLTMRNKFFIVQSPIKAAFFERICFVMLPNRLLVEFVEPKRSKNERI